MWTHDFSKKYFLVCNLLEMSTFMPAIKLTFVCNGFGKRTVYNLQARINFYKKSCDQVDKVIDQYHLSK